MEAPSLEDYQRKQQEDAAREDQRLSILEQILEPSAKDRIQRLALVKPEKARRIEDTLISATLSGQLKTKVTEKQLIDMLDRIEEGESSVKKVTIQRRKFDLDDDDDDDSDML